MQLALIAARVVYKPRSLYKDAWVILDPLLALFLGRVRVLQLPHHDMLEVFIQLGSWLDIQQC